MLRPGTPALTDSPPPPLVPEDATGLCQPRRILLALGDRARRATIRLMLGGTAAPTPEIREAANYAATVRLLRSHHFDCVLVAETLPDGEGLGIVQRFFAAAHPGATAFILLGDSGDTALATRAMRAGALDLLDGGALTAGALRRAIDNATEKMALRADLASKRLDLEERNRVLAQRNEEVSRFYQNVCHELRTPLAATREFVSLVDDGIAGEVSDEQHELLRLALDGCDQIRVLLDDLLDAARIQTGKLNIIRKPYDVAALVREAVRCHHKSAGAASLSIDSETSERLIADVDPVRIRQVLDNLLSNAIKFTPAGGRIEARAMRDPDRPHWIVVSVSDTGCGISPEHQHHIFERLYQAPTPSAGDGVVSGSTAGLGLGLAICREIVRLHDTELAVRSELGEGATFSFVLPCSSTARSPCNQEEGTDR